MNVHGLEVSQMKLECKSAEYYLVEGDCWARPQSEDFKLKKFYKMKTPQKNCKGYKEKMRLKMRARRNLMSSFDAAEIVSVK